MKITLLIHPAWMGSASMPRFARYIEKGMQMRGHEVSTKTAKAYFSRIPIPSPFVKKWLGYLDQFVIFPYMFRKELNNNSENILYVIADQALGMWVPLIADRPHVIHCHDFLALRSALGEIPHNPTSITGKAYQTLIRRGFETGENFISVSKRTRSDLHRFLGRDPSMSDVVYNGLNGPFRKIAAERAYQLLEGRVEANDRKGYILHVGGNQWYKNRVGVVAAYHKYCRLVTDPLPLWMVGGSPNASLKSIADRTPANGRVTFQVGLSDEQVIAAYNLAKLFFFPSIEEGFGWPVIEALACGTQVLTTDDEPMSEIGGIFANYIPKMDGDMEEWAKVAALKIVDLLARNVDVIDAKEHINSFDPERILDEYEMRYEKIMLGYSR